MIPMPRPAPRRVDGRLWWWGRRRQLQKAAPCQRPSQILLRRILEGGGPGGEGSCLRREHSVPGAKYSDVRRALARGPVARYGECVLGLGAPERGQRPVVAEAGLHVVQVVQRGAAVLRHRRGSSSASLRENCCCCCCCCASPSPASIAGVGSIALQIKRERAEEPLADGADGHHRLGRHGNFGLEVGGAPDALADGRAIFDDHDGAAGAGEVSWQ